MKKSSMAIHLYACDTDDSLFMTEHEPYYEQKWGEKEPHLYQACPHGRGDIVLDHRVRYVGVVTVKVAGLSDGKKG